MEMEEKVRLIKGAIAAFCAALTALFGWIGWLIIALVALMSVDFLTGWAAARSRGEWKSSIAKRGISKKVGILAIVVAAIILDWLIGGMLQNLPFININFDYGVLLGPIVACWFILAEIGSIIENAVCMGAACPEFIRKLITVLKATIEKSGDKLTGGKEVQNE